MYLKKGFTLIELLVVIAIIGVLSGVVLASLSKARTKGADAAIKSDLAGVRSQAEILYDNAGDYDAVCGADGEIQDQKIIDQLEGASFVSVGNTTTYICGMPALGTATAWAATVPLKSLDVFDPDLGSGTDYWCVDSAGISKVIDEDIALTDTVCP